MTKPLKSGWRGALCVLALVSTGAWAQSAATLEAVRLHRPNARKLAEVELAACGACEDKARLSLLAGYLALSEGDADSALEQLSKVAPPSRLAAYHGYYLGQAHFYARAPAKAAERFAAALPSAPESLAARLRARLGEAYLAAGDAAQALPYLDQAIAEDESAELYAQRARARALTGNVTGEQEDLRALAVRYPGHPASAAALAKLEAALPQPLTFEERLTRAKGLLETSAQGALEALTAISERKLDRGGTSRAKMALVAANALYSLGRDEDAEEQVKKALKGTPDVAADAALLRAKRLLRFDQNEKARDAMADLEKRYPKTRPAEEAAFLMGWIDVKAGKLERAVEAFEAFEKRYARSRKRDEVLWFHSLALIRLERYADARGVLERLGRDNPHSQLVPQSLYWSARTRQLAGEPASDVTDGYRRVIGSFPGSFYAWLSDARLRELGQSAPNPFPAAPKRLGEKVPSNLQVAVALARTGLVRDAGLEVQRQLSGLRGADKALEYGHALQALGEFGQAHTLAQRKLWGQAFTERSGEALALFFPKAYESAVEAQAKAHDIAPSLVWAIMRRESGFRPEVQSTADARGLMQLLPKTGAAIAKELAQQAPDPDELFSPDINIRLGSWYLGALMKRFKHPTLAAAAYNAGPTAAVKWTRENGKLPLDLFVELIPYKETRGYVKQVVADLYNYRALYEPGKSAPPLPLALPQPDESGVGF